MVGIDVSIFTAKVLLLVYSDTMSPLGATVYCQENWQNNNLLGVYSVKTVWLEWKVEILHPQA